MQAHERLYTKVFKKLSRTIYIDAVWRFYDKKYGLYIIKGRNKLGIGLLVIEIVLYDWRGN